MSEGSDAEGHTPAPEGGSDPLDTPTPPPASADEEGAFDPEATLPPPASPAALDALAALDEDAGEEAKEEELEALLAAEQAAVDEGDDAKLAALLEAEEEVSGEPETPPERPRTTDEEVAALLAAEGGNGGGNKPRRPTEKVPLRPFLSRLPDITHAHGVADELEYSTLHDVQANLLSALEEEHEEAFQRAFPRARKRVHALEEQGHDVGELDERLMLAGLMSGQGDHLGALQAVEEVLVIAKVLDEVGVIEAYEPPPQLTEERVKQLMTDELAPLRVRFERQLTDATERWEQRLTEQLEDRVDELLGEDRFAEAAASATANRPGELLERPELLARIDAVASRLDLSLLVSSNFFERVDKLVRERVARFVEGGRLEALIDGLIRRRVEELVSATVDAQVRGVLGELEGALADLDGTIASQVQLALQDDAFLAEVEARARGVLAEPEAQARILQAVLASSDLVPTLLGDDAFQIGLETRTSALLSTGLFRETLEGSLRESQALAEAVLDGLGSTACAELLDKRIDERTQETIQNLERAVTEARAEAPTDPGVARPGAAPDPAQLAETVQGLIKQALTDKDFRRNVDNRVEELAHRGFLMQRIQELVKREMSQAPPVPDERLEKFVIKAMANQRALQQAKLTGEGISDIGSLEPIIEEKVKAFLVQQMKQKKTKKKTSKKKP